MLLFNLGHYPGDHGIIGNQFYESTLRNPDNSKIFFNHEDERYTEKVKWWSKYEPIWATATKNKLKFSNFLFSRLEKVGDTAP